MIKKIRVNGSQLINGFPFVIIKNLMPQCLYKRYQPNQHQRLNLAHSEYIFPTGEGVQF